VARPVQSLTKETVPNILSKEDLIRGLGRLEGEPSGGAVGEARRRLPREPAGVVSAGGRARPRGGAGRQPASPARPVLLSVLQQNIPFQSSSAGASA
jgi:hypothetical protein